MSLLSNVSRPISAKASLVSKCAIVLALTAAGCGSATGTTAFNHQFRDNHEEDFAAVMERLPQAADHESPVNALGRPLALVTTNDEPRRVVAIDPSTGDTLWAHEIDAQTRPEILGDLVLTSERARIVALDLSTGAERWDRPLADLAYVGAARDGGTIYYAATVGALGGARRVGHLTAVDARTGSERWRHEVQGVFGQPAALGGMVMVPWERQNIAILDEETGVELARLRSTDDVVAWIFQDPTGICYGHQGIYRLTHRSASGTRAESTHIDVPLGDLPRDPDIFDDGFLPKPGTRSARGRIRIYFSPAPASDPAEVRIAGDTYYFVYYRYVFAYGLDGTLRWSRIVEQDIIGAQALENGLFTVGEQGQMHVIDRDSGADRWSGGGGMELAAVDLDVAGFAAGDAPTAAPAPLRESLNQLILDPDNRLVPARGYAVEQLAEIEDPEITRDLLDLYGQRSMPGSLRETIATALRSRRTGPQYLIEALGRRYDFIEDTQAPPLEVIVPSLLEMHAAEAVPQLVQQMNDHETPAAVLPVVVQAITEMGDASVVPALRAFLVFYHADSAFSENADALNWAATGIFRHGGPEGRALLTSMAGEPRTLAALTTSINGLYEAEQHAAEQLAAREAAEAQQALEEAAQHAEAALPSRLSQEAINQTFAEHADALRECVAGEVTRNPLLGQVRLVFILENDGTPNDIGVAPNTPELVTCMQERVHGIQFPRFRQRRQRAAFTISLRGGVPQTTTASSASALERTLTADDPWWTWWQRRGEGSEATTSIRAWWDPRAAPVVPVASSSVAPVIPGTTTTPTTTTPTTTTPTTTEPTGPAWWSGTGAEEEEETVEPETPPEPTPPPPPTPRGRRGRREPEPPPARLPSSVAPTAPPPTAPPPSAPPSTTPPPSAPTPPPPATPPAEENPWWAPAEGG